MLNISAGHLALSSPHVRAAWRRRQLRQCAKRAQREEQRAQRKRGQHQPRQLVGGVDQQPLQQRQRGGGGGGSGDREMGLLPAEGVASLSSTSHSSSVWRGAEADEVEMGGSPGKADEDKNDAA